MRNILGIRRNRIGIRTAKLASLGMVIGFLSVLLVSPAASALSLSLDLDTNVPLLPPLRAQAKATMLEPQSSVSLGVSADKSTSGQTSKPPLIGVSLAPPAPLPPVSAEVPGSNRLPAQSAPAKPMPAPAPTAFVSASPTEITASTAKPTPPTSTSHKPTARPHDFLDFGFPGGFGFLPKNFDSSDGNFRIAALVLSGAAATFLVLAFFSTSRLHRLSAKQS